MDGKQNGQSWAQDVGEDGNSRPCGAGGDKKDPGVFGGCSVAQQSPDEEEEESAFL